MAMLLAVDIGNTNVTLGLFEGDALAASWRLSTDPRRLADEYALQLSQLLPMKGVKPGEVREAALCSVVPPLTGVFAQAVADLFGVEPLIVGAGVRTGVRIRYDNQHDVGADRVVDAAAAYHFYGAPAIVVDFGTATVFDAISADGAYLGGAIAPGLDLAADALFRGASLLRRVEMAPPPAAIGKNTTHAMQSGLVLGYAGLVETMVERFRRELNAPATVIATGGLANTMAAQTSAIDVVDEHLTLRGLAHVFALNRAEEAG